MKTPRQVAPWAIGLLVVLVLGALLRNQGGSPSPTASSTPTTTTSATPSSSGVPVVQDVKNSSVASIIAGLTGESTFAAYFKSTGVATSVTGKGPYTVFVPTNAAFAALPPGTIANLSAAEKKRLVQYHVVEGRAVDLDAVSSGTLTTLSRDLLNVLATTGTKARINNSSAIREYRGSNGTVFVINAVLLPPVTKY